MKPGEAGKQNLWLRAPVLPAQAPAPVMIDKPFHSIPFDEATACCQMSSFFFGLRAFTRQEAKAHVFPCSLADHPVSHYGSTRRRQVLASVQGPDPSPLTKHYPVSRRNMEFEPVCFCQRMLREKGHQISGPILSRERAGDRFENWLRLPFLATALRRTV